MLEEVHWAAANLLGGTGWLGLQESGVAAVAQCGDTAELSWSGGRGVCGASGRGWRRRGCGWG